MKTETELVVDPLLQPQQVENFRLDLLWHHEQVGIILVKGPHPKQAVEYPGHLVAVHQTDLRHPEGQLAIRMGTGTEQKHSARAIHRLDGVCLVVHLGGVHVLAVVFPVSAAFPK